MAQEANINTNEGVQYIALGNGCYMEMSFAQPNPAVGDFSLNDDVKCDAGLQSAVGANRNDDTGSDIAVILSDIRSQLQSINARLDKIEACFLGRLDQVLVFMANFDKLMSTRESAPNSKEKKREAEDFEEFRKLCPILSEDDLQTLERNLKSKVYADRFFRFFDHEYNLNGKREGKVLFKTILRRIVVPTLLQPFSWKGNSRKTDEAASFIPNRSFKDSFPELVLFLQRVIFAADMEHTAEDTEECFSLFLRQKNVEIQRFLEGSHTKRAACSRTRKPKDTNVCDESNLEHEGVITEEVVDQGSGIEIFTSEEVDKEEV